jgi:hypothetical protein
VRSHVGPSAVAHVSSRQRVPERLAHMRSVQAGVVALLRPARGNLEVYEHRTGFAEQGADLLPEDFQVGEVEHDAISGRTREAGEVDPVAARDGVSAIGLIGAVLAHEVIEVRRRDGAYGHQAAEIHQQAAVAIEHDDAPVGPPQRQPQRMGRGEPHGAMGEIVERMWPDVDPVERAAVDRKDW